MSDDRLCSDASLAIGERIGGTAAHARRWIVLEVREPWSRKGFPDCALPQPVIERLARFGAEHTHARVQFIRRPDRCQGPLAFFYADSLEGRVHAFELASPEALLDLDLDTLAAGGGSAPRFDEPLFLVCTHGLRDTCCALKGPTVYRALEARAPGRAWQTTHLGGHRFAATLLALPHGACYGRVSPPQAAAIAAAHSRGRLYRDLERYRGRTCWTPAAQAADWYLREATGELGLDAVSVTGEQDLGRMRWRVELALNERPYTVEVERRRLDAPAPPSCGREAVPPAGFRRVTL